jgi:hypothetical protein
MNNTSAVLVIIHAVSPALTVAAAASSAPAEAQIPVKITATSSGVFQRLKNFLILAVQLVDCMSWLINRGFVPMTFNQAGVVPPLSARVKFPDVNFPGRA